MDDVSFRKPVPIGAILRLDACIPYSRTDAGGQSFQVNVQADVVNPKTGKAETTNTFHFTFAKKDSTNPPPVVLPQSYGEAVLYLDGKRRLELGHEMAMENKSSLLPLW